MAVATGAATTVPAAIMNDFQQTGRIFAQFRSEHGEVKGPQLEIPLDLTPKQLNSVLNELLGNERTDPYSFFVNDQVCFHACSQSLCLLQVCDCFHL